MGVSMTGATARSILLLSFSSMAFASAAMAQDAPEQPPAPAASAPEPSEGATIVVTGTRRTDRTIADSPVPVDVISAESLANTGHTEVNRALTQEVPSFNFPQPWEEVRHEDVWVHPRQVHDLRVLAPLEGGKVKPLFPRIS